MLSTLQCELDLFRDDADVVSGSTIAYGQFTFSGSSPDGGKTSLLLSLRAVSAGTAVLLQTSEGANQSTTPIAVPSNEWIHVIFDLDHAANGWTTTASYATASAGPTMFEPPAATQPFTTVITSLDVDIGQTSTGRGTGVTHATYDNVLCEGH